MADSANLRTGLKTLMQDHLSNKVVSNLFNTMPLVYMMLARDGKKAPGEIYGLGIPGSGVLISGVPMTKIRKEMVLGSDTYRPIIAKAKAPASDGKVMGQRDTVPAPANPTTTGIHTRFVRPFFKWVERADPILVYKKDIRRTKQQVGPNKASEAVGDLFRAETEMVLATHLEWFNTVLWGAATVAPADIEAEVWSTHYSLAAALKNDNIYAGVDRSVSGNEYWRGNYVTAARPVVLEDLVNEVDYTLGARKKGKGVDLFICGGDLFPTFKAEAKAKGGTVFHNGLPEMGEFGFRREIVRFNETYVIYDPACPEKTVAGLNLDTWTIAISPEANFSVDEPFDLTKTAGGADAMKSQVRTEAIIACEAPDRNFYFTNVGGT